MNYMYVLMSCHCISYVTCANCNSFNIHLILRSQGRSRGNTDISSIFPCFPVGFLYFSPNFFIFFLIVIFEWAARPPREGPGYATVMWILIVLMLFTQQLLQTNSRTRGVRGHFLVQVETLPPPPLTFCHFFNAKISNFQQISPPPPSSPP